MTQLDRIEATLTQLQSALAALLEFLAAETDDEQMPLDLDGRGAGGERDQSQPL
jgi:hypothetical protein